MVDRRGMGEGETTSNEEQYMPLKQNMQPVNYSSQLPT
jgi:hypothetical protein